MRTGQSTDNIINTKEEKKKRRKREEKGDKAKMKESKMS
jgi:hypothetical protein